MTENHTMGAEEIFSLRFIQSAALSPDGTTAVFGRSEVDRQTDRDQCSLWTVDVAGSEIQRLTGATALDLNPEWSPDGRSVAFQSNRSGTQQLYILSPGGEPRQVTELPNGIAGRPRWSPDGTMLAFSLGSQEAKRDPSHAYRVSRPIYRFDGLGYLDDVVQSIAVVDLASRAVTVLTSDRAMNTNPVWTPDGTRLAYLASFDPDWTRPGARIRMVDLRGTIREFEHPAGSVSRLRVGADGRLVFVLDGRADRQPGSKGDLWVLDPESGELDCRTDGFGIGVGAALLADTPVVPESGLLLAGDDAFLSVADGGQVGIYRIALSGEESYVPVVGGDRSCLPAGLAGDTLLFVEMDVNTPGDLRACGLDGGAERRLTAINEELLTVLDLPEVEHLEYTSVDGAAVEGWFYRPSTGAMPYPTVVNIHGGPHISFGRTFSCDVHRLVGAGYAVLHVNHRGSTGYGDTFATAAIGDRGNLDYQDVIAGVDHVVGIGLADPERLGLFGISGGGNLSCWIVGHTNRFKAAVAENPVTNFLSVYGVSDVGTSLIPQEMAGTPADSMENYLRCSPISYAHHCTTPTLMIQSEGDLRAHPEQSEQFYATLKANGCTTEMLRLPGVYHDGSRRGPVHIRRAQNESMVEWMDRNLLGHAPVEVLL